MFKFINSCWNDINNGRLTFKAVLFIYCLMFILLWIGENINFF